MRKLNSLRTAITAALPELARSPEMLRVWIERGTGRCHGTRTESFAFAFQANVLIAEMSSDIAVLGHAVFRWLRIHQPELLAPGAEGFAFDADILDNGSADVLLQLQLSENVTVAQQPQGGYSMHYLAEADPLFDDDLGLGGTAPVPPLADVEWDIDLPPWNT
jgi:P2 phage tail completion protein R (GpR).